MKNKISLAPQAYLLAVHKRRATQVRRVMYGTITVLVLIVTVATSTNYGQSVVASIAFAQEAVDSTYEEEYYDAYSTITENGCNVLGITIYGEIGTTYASDYVQTTSNDVRSTLDYAQDESIKAVLVEVDSPGGSPVAADEINQLLAEQSVPVVAHIREMGTSGGYGAILSSDRIFMHKYGSVGSIGVIYAHYDYTQKNKQDGIKYQPIVTGDKKDAGSPDRPMTTDERARIQDEIDLVFEGFVSDVATYRGLSRAEVLRMADGSTFMASEALSLGLIDEVGGHREVREHLSAQIGEPAVVCWDYELGL